MTPSDITTRLDTIEKACAEIRQFVSTPPTRVVRAGENLQSRVDEGGVIEMEAGAVFPALFVRRPVVLTGNAMLLGTRGQPALDILPGSREVTVACQARAESGAVVRVGALDATQTHVEDAPVDITLSVVIPSHRGKRGFEIHGAAVSLLNCIAEDIWDPNGQDSQAVWIGNAPGPVYVGRGRFSAGSEVILTGGALTPIPNLIPAEVTIEDSLIYRPVSWMTDGVARKVKNLIEFKSIRGVVVRGCRLSGCWANGQEGQAFMITPTSEGTRLNPPYLSHTSNIRIEGNVVEQVGTLAAIVGRDYTSYTEVPTTDVVFRGNHVTCSRQQFGGRGQVATLLSGCGEIVFDQNVCHVDGSSLIYIYRGNRLDAMGVMQDSGPMQRLVLTNNLMGIVGEYGLNVDGYPNARNTQVGLRELVADGNTYGTVSGAAGPGRYVTAAEFEQLWQQAPQPVVPSLV